MNILRMPISRMPIARMPIYKILIRTMRKSNTKNYKCKSYDYDIIDGYLKSYCELPNKNNVPNGWGKIMLEHITNNISIIETELNRTIKSYLPFYAGLFNIIHHQITLA